VSCSSVGCLTTEQEELLREMGQQAAKPTPEVSLLRQQVDQLHSRHRTELALIEHERLQLQQRLQDEVFSSVMYLCLHRVVVMLCSHVSIYTMVWMVAW